MLVTRLNSSNLSFLSYYSLSYSQLTYVKSYESLPILRTYLKQIRLSLTFTIRIGYRRLINRALTLYVANNSLSRKRASSRSSRIRAITLRLNIVTTAIVIRRPTTITFIQRRYRIRISLRSIIIIVISFVIDT